MHDLHELKIWIMWLEGFFLLDLSKESLVVHSLYMLHAWYYETAGIMGHMAFFFYSIIALQCPALKVYSNMCCSLRIT